MINEQILAAFRERIIEVLYKIDENHDPKFIKTLVKHRIKYRMFSDLSEETLNPIKLDYLDSNAIIMRRNINKPDKIRLENIETGKLFYKTQKFLLARGKIYMSIYDYTLDRPIPNFEPIPMVLINKNLELLWAEKDFVYFLEKTS